MRRASSRLGDRQARRLLHRLEDDRRPRRAHAGNAPEKRVRRSWPEMLGVARAHFDEIAVVAGDVVHLEDLGELGEGLRDPILGRRLRRCGRRRRRAGRGREPWDRSGRRSRWRCLGLRACGCARGPPRAPVRRLGRFQPGSRGRWPGGARGSGGRYRRVFCRSAQYSHYG